MQSPFDYFDERAAIAHLHHYLPQQAALKDFVHHNTLHAFQSHPFHEALHHASEMFGYTTYLSLEAYRRLYQQGKITDRLLEKSLICHHGAPDATTIAQWKNRLLHEHHPEPIEPRIGKLRATWKNKVAIDLDKSVHPILFRLLGSFLDQGIASRQFPHVHMDFTEAIQLLEKESYGSIFRTQSVREIFLQNRFSISELLGVIVGDAAYFEQYLFDQQFAHSGWSGFVGVIQHQPQTLLCPRHISLEALILLELYLELDALIDKFGEDHPKLIDYIDSKPIGLFDSVPSSEVMQLCAIWQEAYEWSYYDTVLRGIQDSPLAEDKQETDDFQAIFCIDDRSYSLRRHVEQLNPNCSTYGTPGFFGIEFWFQPEHSKFHTKACPAPVEPTFLVREKNRTTKRKKDVHLSNKSHSLFEGWAMSSTLGFTSGFKLMRQLLFPGNNPLATRSIAHMDKHAQLEFEYTGETENGLQVGFTYEEMAERVYHTLKSIGLTANFAPLVFIIGHGGSSVNNPYYAGYDCGACCGRPGAVNARVFAAMANLPQVRQILREKGLELTDSTRFVGAMHDTTRDEMEFYDDDELPPGFLSAFETHRQTLLRALDYNAHERAFRFDTMSTKGSLKQVHAKIKLRSMELFETRPEWNHTDNALCLIGRRNLYANLYLDKRPFINSYDYRQDPSGEYLFRILSATIPVCGGINLEYYFSRVDQHRLGSGSKLPHNVVGLFALNTGVEGDLRPGLPAQMIEQHNPVRILFVIEHYPELVSEVLRKNANLHEWVNNEWIQLVVKHPETPNMYRFSAGRFMEYEPETKQLIRIHDQAELANWYGKNEPVLTSLNSSHT
jgi:uncharacterized protein